MSANWALQNFGHAHVAFSLKKQKNLKLPNSFQKLIRMMESTFLIHKSAIFTRNIVDNSNLLQKCPYFHNKSEISTQDEFSQVSQMQFLYTGGV